MMVALDANPLPTGKMVFFRNDDVNALTPELEAVSEILFRNGIPVIHAIEPANLTEECTHWLLEQKAKYGRLLEITQHGYQHTVHDRGEFGGARGYEDQRRDLERGMAIMNERFGNQWFPCLNFPYGLYNADSIRAMSDLGYTVFSGHFNPRFSRRLFYRVGRFMGRGLLFDKHVSHHLQHYPGTKLFCVDVSVSYIARYHGDYGSQDCDWHSQEHLLQQHEVASRHLAAVGWLLHHRYHTSSASLRLVEYTINQMRERDPQLEFFNSQELYERFGKPSIAKVD